MFQKIRHLWSNNGFEIVLGLSVAFILIYALYNKIVGNKGTWSKQYYYSIPPKPKKPRITESKGETECRKCLQNIFKRNFPKCRPDFLRNPVTGNFNLELDCYNSELKLAVEYNGIQHYKYVPYFHKNKEAFMNQKYRDLLKRDLCSKNNINLIEVPYTVKIPNIQQFIVNEAKNLGYLI